MIKVAITGNIASGKSKVVELISDLGYKVYDADKIAHEILYSSNELLAMIIVSFNPFSSNIFLVFLLK